MSASAVAPLLRYRDPNKAADWLCRAFGFKIDKVERESDGSLRFISLDAGQSSILVGPAGGTQLDEWLVQPEDIGGYGTQTCYLQVDDIAAHRGAAEAAGARIEMEPMIDEDGSAYYVCRDPEGHLWSFGTHSFTRERPAAPIAPAPPLPLPELRSRIQRSPISVLVGVVALLIGGSLLVYASSDFGGAPGANAPAAGGGGQTRTRAFALLMERSKKEREKRIAAEQAAKDADARHKEAQAIGAQLRTALNEAKSALQTAQQQKAKAETELQTLEVAADNQLRTKQVELDRAKQKVAALQNSSAAEMTTVKEELERAIRKVGELETAKTAELSSTKEELRQARQKVEELETAKTAEVSSTRKELDRAKRKVEELEAAKTAEVSSTRKELDRAKRKVEELEAAKTAEVSSTREELDRAKRKVKELEVAKTAELSSTREELDRAKRKVRELEVAKAQAMNSAKEGLKLAKRKVAELVAAKSAAVNSAKEELGQARQKVASLETAKAAALASARTAAEKLNSANELNRALQDKLDEASNSVLTVRRKNAELETALVDIREKFQTKVEENQRKLSFASPEFAKVTKKLEAERKRAEVAEAALAKTSKDLEVTRSEAKRLAVKVQSLQTELKNSYSNTRLRFSALQIHDAEVAVLSQPKSAWKPVIKPTPNPERKSKTIVKRRHIAASNTASSRKAKKSEARRKNDRKKERKRLAALQKKKREEKAESRAPKEVSSACARALWSTTLKRGGWSKSSKRMITSRLCSHNPNSAEPAKCFNMLMSGQVSWGAGSKWSSQHALRLCSGSPSASTTIGCFRSSVANMGWRDAILQCT